MGEEVKMITEPIREDVEETQIQGWIHPDGMFEMNIKARNEDELKELVKFIDLITGDRYF